MALAALPSPGNHRYPGRGAERRHRGAGKKIQGKVLMLNMAFVSHPVPPIALVTAGSGLSLAFSFNITPGF